MTTPYSCRALYVHVPFCRTLCGYCDFYSEVLRAEAVAPLVDALLRELEGRAARRTLAFDTIYVGGGTPTVLPPGQLGRLLGGVRAYADAGEQLEFTVEANPATVTDEVAGVLAGAGVNRVSLGAQSFEPAELRVLERRHRPEQVGETVVTCGLVVEQRTHHQITGEPMKFLTLADWTGMVETELFAQTYKSYGLATVRYPVLEVTATVEPFENGRGFSLRVLRAGKPRIATKSQCM